MPMIETVNLTKKYGELTALNNLNLNIEQGDCFGFIGPNGAGKTTTIKILATLLKPTWGEARIDGKVIGYQNREIRPVMGYVPDFMGAYEDMKVTEYLEFFAAAYNIHGKQRQQVVKDVLDLTDLTYKADSDVNGLSRGMQQRLSIARVLLHDPRVLLMDEPASGLDPRARVEIRELLKELRRMGKTILISSHILHELAELCNSVGIIERGELLYQGLVRDIMQKARVGQVVHIILERNAAMAAEFLAKVPGVEKVARRETEDGDVLDVTLSGDGKLPLSDIPSRLMANGFRITRFVEEQVNLETAFMRLTQGIVQ